MNYSLLDLCYKSIELDRKYCRETNCFLMVASYSDGFYALITPVKGVPRPVCCPEVFDLPLTCVECVNDCFRDLEDLDASGRLEKFVRQMDSVYARVREAVRLSSEE